MSNNKRTFQLPWGWYIFFLVLLIIVAGYFLPQLFFPGLELDPATSTPGGIFFTTWLVIAALMLVSFVVIGLSLNKGPLGILIDHRNMMSLSRFQIVIWTLVILSGFVAVALVRVSDARIYPSKYVCSPPQSESGEPLCADPIGIQLPPLLWALMGISVTSAVASPVLKAVKAQSTEDQDQARIQAFKISGKVGPGPATYGNVLERVKKDQPQGGALDNEGALVKKEKWSDARFADVFMGEEVGTFMYVDIAKVQNFFFTIVAVVAYSVALAADMAAAAGISKFFAFPDLPAGLIAIISISHGGYLTDKAFTHTTPAVPPPGE